MNTRRLRAAGLAVAVTVVALLLMGQAAQRYDWLIAKQLTVTNATTLNDATLGGDMTLSLGDLAVTVGNITATAGDVTSGDDMTVGDDFTVTDNATVSGTLTVVETVTAADLSATDDGTIGDDLTVTDDTVLTSDLAVGGNTTLTGTTNMLGNVSDGNSALTVVDNVLIDGAADAVQLTVQGYTTNTSALLVVENSAGVDQFSVSNAGTATVAGQVLATGDVRTGTDMQVAQVLRVVPNAAIAVTNGAAFTPTGTYQPLTSAGTVTPTITATDADAGDVLILINESATTINLADTGTTKLSAAWAGGQYDTLTLLSDGVNWIELSRTDN